MNNIYKFNLVSRVIDDAPVLCAITGGAVRDLVTGIRDIKDFDIFVHERNAQKLVDYLESVGFESVDDRVREVGPSDSSDFAERYSRYVQMKKTLLGVDLILDLLVLADSKFEFTEVHDLNYYQQIPGEFIEGIRLFDNTINQWIYCRNQIVWFGAAADYGTALELKELQFDRVYHVASIARDLGWKYVSKDED